MNGKIVCIYGTGPHARVIASTIEAQQRQIAMFFDDDQVVVESSNNQYAPGLTLSAPNPFAPPNHPFLIAIGNNRTRASIANQLKVEFTTTIHPSAVIAPCATVSEGSVVLAHATLQTDVFVGDQSIINTSASIDHDCRLGNFVHIAPNATLCGDVHVGEGTHVGAGATVIEHIRIGKWATVGAGAVVIRDVPDFATVVGCPARTIKEHLTDKTKMESIEHLQSLCNIINNIRQSAGRDSVSELKVEHHLQRDLELDSLELAEITVLIESKFGVDVFEEGTVTTVQDVLNKLK
ncbi:NeuD/PglB/VioB family sugar acetyltransferase [bacterium]|nr:NeuD/PglB/VioB family sugar acetyltransferase [bacterium]